MAGMMYDRPEPSKLIGRPQTHLRLIVTEAAKLLRAHKFARAFETYNEAIAFIQEEMNIGSTGEGGQFRELIDTWEAWYTGPSNEPTYWVGPPGSS